MFGVAVPTAAHFDPFAGVEFGEVADDGDEGVTAVGVFVGEHVAVVWLEAQDGVAVFGVVVGDAFDGAADFVGWGGHGG